MQRMETDFRTSSFVCPSPGFKAMLSHSAALNSYLTDTLTPLELDGLHILCADTARGRGRRRAVPVLLGGVSVAHGRGHGFLVRCTGSVCEGLFRGCGQEAGAGDTESDSAGVCVLDSEGR